MADATHFGRYELRGLVGSGGMGEVYEAFDREQHRTVALKLLPAALASDEGFVERFRRESFAAAQLNDPHVIPIHRYGDIDGRLYIDMRLVKGDDLAGVLERDGPLDAHRAVSFTAQAAEALDAAHAANLIHRDVKPSNLLITPGDFVYLVDFGIAHVFGMGTTGKALTATGATIGTLDYMAPERFIGRTEVDARTDVYSLTCVLYECLTGTRPFPVEGLPALLHAHLNSPPPRPSATRPELPAALDDVIARGMAKNPDDRYATTGELAQDATNALRGLTPSGPIPATAAWLPPARPSPPTVAEGGAPASQYQPPADPRPPSLPAPTYIPTGPQPDAGQFPPGGQPPYNTPPPYGERPPYGGQPLYGGQPSSGGQPPYAGGLPPTGFPPPGGNATAWPAPEEPRRRNTGWIVAAAVLVVTAIAAVVIVARLATSSTASPPSESSIGSTSSAPSSTAPTTSAVASSEAAAPAAPMPSSAAPAPIQTVTATATQTVLTQAPAVPTAPEPAPAPAPAPSRGSGDLGLSDPIRNIGCTGEYLTFVGSSTNPSGYQAEVQSFLNGYGGSSYLMTESSCSALTPTVNGNSVYSIYFGPFSSDKEACAVSEQFGGSYVKVLAPVDPDAARIEC